MPKSTFRYPSPIAAKISEYSLRVDSCWGFQIANAIGDLTVKLFSKNFNQCDHNPPTLQTDGRTTYYGNTALCVASFVKTK